MQIMLNAEKKYAKSLQDIQLNLAEKNINNYLQSALTEPMNVDINFLNYLIHYEPKKVECFFEKFLNENTKQENVNALQELLLNFNENGSSCLHFAAHHHPKLIEIVLKYISKNISLFDKTNLLQLFLNQNKFGWNLLSIVALNQPDYLKNVVKFITQHKKVFKKNEVLNMFLIKKEEGFLLNLIDSYQLDLKVLIELIRKCKPDAVILKKLFLSVNNDGKNLLTTSYCHPANLKTLSGFITDHINLFDRETQAKFLQLSNEPFQEKIEKHKNSLSNDREKKSISNRFFSLFSKPNSSNAEKITESNELQKACYSKK